jgi:hypothetical protein
MLTVLLEGCAGGGYLAEPLSSLAPPRPGLSGGGSLDVAAERLTDPRLVARMLGGRAGFLAKDWFTLHVVVASKNQTDRLIVNRVRLRVDRSERAPLETPELTMLVTLGPVATGRLLRDHGQPEPASGNQLLRDSLPDLSRTAYGDTGISGSGGAAFAGSLLLIGGIANLIGEKADRAYFDDATPDIAEKGSVPRLLDPGERREFLLVFHPVGVQGPDLPQLVVRYSEKQSELEAIASFPNF